MINKYNWQRDFGMSWRRRVIIFWDAMATLVTLGLAKPKFQTNNESSPVMVWARAVTPRASLDE